MGTGSQARGHRVEDVVAYTYTKQRGLQLQALLQGSCSPAKMFQSLLLRLRKHVAYRGSSDRFFALWLGLCVFDTRRQPHVSTRILLTMLVFWYWDTTLNDRGRHEHSIVSCPVATLCLASSRCMSYHQRIALLVARHNGLASGGSTRESSYSDRSPSGAAPKDLPLM